jgi:bifunctional UDP-N-acetylglucosamine pyrophosphorylase / glucosamine-1-phosphate N-acetyltransferase
VSQPPPDSVPCPRPAAVIVLAAGAGTRMRSALPKVLHEIGGRSLLGHALAAAEGLRPDHLAVVVRHGRDLVAAHVRAVAPRAVIADQDEITGTGRATLCGLRALPALTGTVVVTYGDVPLLRTETLADLLRVHHQGGNAVTMLTAQVEDPTGYGRVLRVGDALTAADPDLVAGVVEHRDADERQRAIREINSGIYVFDAVVLASALGEVGSDNAQGEQYLTDVLTAARGGGGRVAAHRIDDVWQTEGVNDRAQLAGLGGELNRRVVHAWMLAGVTVLDPASTWVDVQVRLGRDVRLLPGTQLLGRTVVEDDATVGPDSTLTDVVVRAGASVVRTHGSGCEVGPGAKVGPFAYLRPGTRLGEAAKVGAFVETKNAEIGAGSKVPHLTYVGDATIGEHCNIGASSVFVNYDGVTKARTTIGDHCKTGSDNMFVAPVSVGDGAYTGAGTVVRQDVPPGALAVNVAPQRNIPGWTLAKRAGTPAAEAAARALGPTEGKRP